MNHKHLVYIPLTKQKKITFPTTFSVAESITSVGAFLSDIPIIPDLDDMQDEDLASEIAHAPA